MNFFNRNKIKDYFGIKSQKLTGFFPKFCWTKNQEGIDLEDYTMVTWRIMNQFQNFVSDFCLFLIAYITEKKTNLPFKYLKNSGHLIGT